MATIHKYLCDIASQTLEPIGMWGGEYSGIVPHNAHHWRERRVMAEISIPVNDNTKLMLKEIMPYFDVSEVKFQLIYFKTINTQGSWWVKQ